MNNSLEKRGEAITWEAWLISAPSKGNKKRLSARVPNRD